MQRRQRLHHLIDQLPDKDVSVALRVLEALRDTAADPLVAALERAPIDDALSTPDEDAAVAEAWDDIRTGRVLTTAELLPLLHDESSN